MPGRSTRALEVATIVIDDIRRFAFPLVVGKRPTDPAQALPLDTTDYLGTAFSVTKNGVALTAAHLLPTPDNLNGRELIAVIWDGKVPRAYLVEASLVPNGTDLAILKIEGVRTPHLPLSFRDVHMGEDVQAVGIPDHSTWNADRDFRLFKGHVTRARRFLELSFPAPRGLSGSPVFCDGSVIAVISGNHRSEALEDQLHEVDEITPGVTRITRVETKAVVNYGLAQPLSPLSTFNHEMFESLAFPEFVRRMNARSDS